MQAAGMLRGTGAAAVSVYLLGTLLLLAFIGDDAHAHPLQVLPNIPGYIPVYIRLGDQPLRDINPALAEAFHEKEVLENTPPEDSHRVYENYEKITDNNPSYDENEEDDDEGGLNVNSRSKDTIYLVGVRQSNNVETKIGNVPPKIALPFEIIERGTVGKPEDGQDRVETEDAWIEDRGRSHGRKPIALANQAIIKVGGLPIEVKELEKLATEVENEETRPNDIYDTSIVKDSDEFTDRSESHIGKVSVRRPVTDRSVSADTTKERNASKANNDEDDTNEDTRLRPVEDLKEFGSSRSMSNEPILRPARDPKESRPNYETADFMVEEE